MPVDPSKLSEADLNKYFNNYIQMPEEQKAQLPTSDPLVMGFRTIEQQMREQGINPRTVAEGDRQLGPEFTGMLRMGGAGIGTGLGIAIPGVGVPLGGLLSLGAEAWANSIDQAEERPTEAVPFSSLFGEGISTGDPVRDALASEGILSAIPAVKFAKGMLGEALQTGKNVLSNIRHLGAGESTAKLISKTLDKDVLESVLELERLGNTQFTITPKSKLVKSTTARFLSTIVGSEVKDEKLAQKTAEEITSLFYDVYKVNENLDEAQSVIQGYIDGSLNARKMSTAIKAGQELTTEEKVGIISVLRGRANVRGLEQRLDLTKRAFINSKPNVAASVNTYKNLQSAAKVLRGLNVNDIPELSSVKGDILKLEKKLFEVTQEAPSKIVDAKGNPVQTTPRLSLSAKGTLMSKENPENARAILNIVDNLEYALSKEYGELTNTQAKEIKDVLLPIKNSIEKDIFDGLTDTQKAEYGAYQVLAKQYNSIPDTLLRNITNGNFAGLMEESVKSRAAAQALVNVVGKDTAGVSAAVHLMERFRSQGKIDFVKMGEFINSGTNRAGILEMMGSERLQMLRHFANTASGLDIDKSGNFLNRMITYSATGAAGGFLFNPVVGAKTAGVTGVLIGTELFLKRILFNERLGRRAVELLKEAPTNTQARKDFAKMMGALNGTEATAVYMDQKGEVQSETPIRIRIDGNGQFQMDVLD